jgi:hypothetical protein
MIARRMVCLMLAVIAGLMCFRTVLAQETEPEKLTEQTKAWYAFYGREADEAYQFRLQPNDRILQRDKTPVLRWTNPLEQGDIHGVVYIWRFQGRPIVLGQLFSYLDGKGGRVYCHSMHSLGRKDETIQGLRNGTVFWTPDSPGVEMQEVPEMAAPAATRALRLVQMKAISRRFTAYTDEETRGKRHLRLLPTPMDRFPENTAGVRDGALFSLVVGNDPEVILLVEASEDSGTTPVWRYGLCRSTRSNCAAQLDDREVWTYDSTNVNPSDPRNGYLSVHGIDTLPLEPPESSRK